MSNLEWLTGTVLLTISANIIEDDTAVGGTSLGTGVKLRLHVQRRQPAPKNIIG